MTTSIKPTPSTILLATLAVASLIIVLWNLFTISIVQQGYANIVTIPQPFNYIIYKNGSYYTSHSFNGATISDKDPAQVFQATLNDFTYHDDPQVIKGQVFPGSIYVTKGDYTFFPNFTGLNLNQYTRLTLDPFAHLIVPNGYKGYVFNLEANNKKIRSSNNIIDGGIISENSTNTNPKRLWTAFQLLSSSTSNNKTSCEANGVFLNKIINTDIHNASIGIDLKVTGNGSFINSNSFDSLSMWNNFIFINFNMTTPYMRGSDCQGIFRNHFENINAESANTTQFKTGYGVRNILNKENTFIDVRIWDFPSVPIGNNSDGIPDHNITPSARIANIAPNSSNNIIIGGIMTSNDTKNPNRSFEDNGTGTMIFDKNWGISAGSNGSKFIPQFAISSNETDREKLGFFGAEPIIQQDAGTNPSLQTIIDVLKKYGLLK